MTTAKQKAARPGRVKAASTTTSSPNHSTQPARIVIAKNAFEELQIGVNEYIGADYLDVRVFKIRAGRSVPTPKGITIPLALLPALIDGLTKARDDRYRVAQG